LREKPYKSKPYEQAQHPGQLVQLDVTVLSRRCIAGLQLKLYPYTALRDSIRHMRPGNSQR